MSINHIIEEFNTHYNAQNYEKMKEIHATIQMIAEVSEEKEVKNVAKEALKETAKKISHFLPPVGLKNHGTDCWGNAMTHLICDTTLWSRIRDYLPKEDFSLLFLQFDRYLKDKCNHPEKTSKADTQLIRKALREQGLNANSYSQEDAHEALMILMNRVDAEKSSLFTEIETKAYHEIKETNLSFSGTVDFSSLDAHNTRVEKEYIYQILLPLQNQNNNFSSLMKSYFNHDLIGSADAKYFDTQGKLNLYSRVREEKIFSTIPKAILITLQRYGSTSLGFNFHINSEIPAPQEFTLSDTRTKTGQRAHYQLKGFMRHMGESLRSGHYVAYIKTGEENWVECNDSRISPLTSDEVDTDAAKSNTYYYENISSASTLSLPDYKSPEKTQINTFLNYYDRHSTLGSRLK